MLLKSEFNKPLKPTAINIEIARNKGISVAIKAINKSLQVSKSNPTPSLSKIIKQKIKENN